MFPYQRKREFTYKAHLENILYHVKRARKEMQTEKDRWQIDVHILNSLEADLLRAIKETEKNEGSISNQHQNGGIL